MNKQLLSVLVTILLRLVSPDAAWTQMQVTFSINIQNYMDEGLFEATRDTVELYGTLFPLSMITPLIMEPDTLHPALYVLTVEFPANMYGNTVEYQFAIKSMGIRIRERDILPRYFTVQAGRLTLMTASFNTTSW